MKQTLALALSLAAVCCAAPANLGLRFDKRAGSLPTLKLPYATYQAANYNPNGDVCLSHHISSVPTSNVFHRSTLSKTSASPPRQSEIFDGRNQPLRRRRQKSKMALTAPFASRHLSKALN